MKLHQIVVNQLVVKEFIDFLYAKKCYIFGIKSRGIYNLIEFGTQTEFNYFQDHLDNVKNFY
jgi:hypothetical protein